MVLGRGGRFREVSIFMFLWELKKSVRCGGCSFGGSTMMKELDELKNYVDFFVCVRRRQDFQRAKAKMNSLSKARLNVLVNHRCMVAPTRPLSLGGEFTVWRF